jgi:tRNA-Thr(GGU) m(6)t(6)A37 methyltransferase TsaA
MLRIESGAGVVTGKNPSDNLETAISQKRSDRLRSCLPHSDDRDLQRAMRDAAAFAEDVCAQIQQQEGWQWPLALAVKTRTLLQKGITGAAGLTPVCMKPIGIVENEVNELLPPREIKAKPSRIIVDASLNEGLEGLSGGQRLLVVFQFHRLSGYELRQHPKNNPALPKRGVFALHSPLRPNPIGVTEVDLVRREGNVLHVRGLDAVNGTPVLDLKLNR